jgi:hypothetical protein
MVTGMKRAVFWDAALCSDDDHPIMEAVSSSELSVSIYHTTQCYIPEDSLSSCFTYIRANQQPLVRKQGTHLEAIHTLFNMVNASLYDMYPILQYKP